MRTSSWISGLAVAIGFALCAPVATAAEIKLSPDIAQAEFDAPIKLSVILDAPAPIARSVSVTSSHPTILPLPASLLVPAGSVTSQTIQIRPNAVSADTVVTLTLVPAAPLPKGVAPTTRQLTVLAPPTITALTFSPTQVTAAQSSTASITVSRSAAYAGLRAALTSTTTSVAGTTPQPATVPASVSINQGSASGSFAVQSAGSTPGFDVNVHVTASLGSSTRSANLTVKPDTSAVLAALEIPATIISDAPAITGKVRFTTAVVGQKVVQLSATGPAPVASNLRLNPGSSNSVVVNHGQIEATFSITASAFPAGSPDVTAQVTATFGEVSKSAQITIVTPPAIASIAIPSPMVSRAPAVQGQVTLTKPALQDEVVNLSPGLVGVLTMPANVTIPTGGTAATFNVSATLSPSSFPETPVTVRATSARTGFSVTTVVAVRPIISTFTLSATDIPGGHPATGTVTLSAPAPAGGRRVDTSRTQGFRSYTVEPNILIIPEGQTTGTIQINTQLPGQADNQTLETDNAKLGVSVSPDGQLERTFVVRRPRITSLTFTVSPLVLAGNNNRVSGTVTLNAPAPPDRPLSASVQCSAPSLPAMCESLAGFSIPAGQTSATFLEIVPFDPFTTPDLFNVQYTIGATGTPSASVFGSVTAPITLRVLKVASVSLAANGVPGSTHIAVPGGTQVTATVALDVVAPVNFVLGLQLGTSNGQPSACLNGVAPFNTWAPGAFTIPAGQQQGTFTINTQAPSCAVQLKADVIADGNKRRAALIDLQPPP